MKKNKQTSAPLAASCRQHRHGDCKDLEKGGKEAWHVSTMYVVIYLQYNCTHTHTKSFF